LSHPSRSISPFSLSYLSQYLAFSLLSISPFHFLTFPVSHPFHYLISLSTSPFPLSILTCSLSHPLSISPLSLSSSRSIFKFALSYYLKCHPSQYRYIASSHYLVPLLILLPHGTSPLSLSRSLVLICSLGVATLLS
jgi:hypothetical protein